MSIRSIALFLAFSILVLNSFAQGKYGNYWVFSQFLGLNFNYNPLPVADTSRIYGPQLPTASICDQHGNLSCYVGTWKWADFGIRLYNKYHTLVKGGDSLFILSGSQYTQYSGYSALLPFSKLIDSLMLVNFSVNEVLNNHNLNYSLIDTRANGDTGVIFSSNNKVIDFKGIIGAIGYIRHANGRDWWILVHGYPNNKFHKFLASPWKVEYMGEQAIGTVSGILDTTFSNWESMGEISVNLNGDKLAMCNFGGLIEAYNFDRCSGLLSNPMTLQRINVINNNILNMQAANISPSGRFVYAVSYYTQPPGPSPVSSNLGQIVQYDLQATDPANDTVVVYGFRDIDSYIDQLEYGPDGRMWFTGRSPTLPNNLSYPHDSMLHFIEYPDLKGHACNVKFNQVYLNGRKANSGMPNMPNYNLGPIDGSICDTLGLDAVSTEPVVLDSKQIPLIYPNPSGSQGAVLIIPHLIENTRVHIYDGSGKLVWAHACDTDKLPLPTQLSPGLYRVVVTGMEGVSWRVE